MRLYHALSLLDGWGGQREVVAAIRSDIYNASLQIASRLGGQVDESDWKTLADFLPDDEQDERPPKRPKVYVQPAAEQLGTLRSIAGV